MKYVTVNVTLHTRAKLIEEFKEGRHAKWDPDQEIEMWRERVDELAEESEQPF